MLHVSPQFVWVAKELFAAVEQANGQQGCAKVEALCKDLWALQEKGLSNKKCATS